MIFAEDVDKAGRYARSAFDLMGRHRIAPVPLNFTLCYSYVSRSVPALADELDDLLQQKTELTTEVAEGLYAKHFGFDLDAVELRTTGRRIHSIFDEVLNRLMGDGEASADYRERLGKLSAELKAGAESGNLQGIVTRVLADSRKLAERNRELENQLSSASTEIGSLQQNLERATQESITDPLTGLSNRKHFDARLRAASEAAEAGSDDLCLLMADVDFFKKFNDRYGHRVGDQVLMLVGRILSSMVQGDQLPARFGGEEFAAILPGTTIQTASALGEKLRRTLAGKEIADRKSGASYGRVTLSIGIARYRSSEGPSRLIHRADEALYQAKREGRNRVVDEGQLVATGGRNAAA